MQFFNQFDPKFFRNVLSDPLRYLTSGIYDVYSVGLGISSLFQKAWGYVSNEWLPNGMQSLRQRKVEALREIKRQSLHHDEEELKKDLGKTVETVLGHFITEALDKDFLGASIDRVFLNLPTKEAIAASGDGQLEGEIRKGAIQMASPVFSTLLAEAYLEHPEERSKVLNKLFPGYKMGRENERACFYTFDQAYEHFLKTEEGKRFTSIPHNENEARKAFEAVAKGQKGAFERQKDIFGKSYQEHIIKANQRISALMHGAHLVSLANEYLAQAPFKDGAVILPILEGIIDAERLQELIGREEAKNLLKEIFEGQLSQMVADGVNDVKVDQLYDFAKELLKDNLEKQKNNILNLSNAILPKFKEHFIKKVPYLLSQNVVSGLVEETTDHLKGVVGKEGVSPAKPTSQKELLLKEIELFSLHIMDDEFLEAMVEELFKEDEIRPEISELIPFFKDVPKQTVHQLVPMVRSVVLETFKHTITQKDANEKDMIDSMLEIISTDNIQSLLTTSVFPALQGVLKTTLFGQIFSSKKTLIAAIFQAKTAEEKEVKKKEMFDVVVDEYNKKVKGKFRTELSLDSLETEFFQKYDEIEKYLKAGYFRDTNTTSEIVRALEIFDEQVPAKNSHELADLINLLVFDQGEALKHFGVGPKTAKVISYPIKSLSFFGSGIISSSIVDYTRDWRGFGRLLNQTLKEQFGTQEKVKKFLKTTPPLATEEEQRLPTYDEQLRETAKVVQKISVMMVSDESFWGRTKGWFLEKLVGFTENRVFSVLQSAIHNTFEVKNDENKTLVLRVIGRLFYESNEALDKQKNEKGLAPQRVKPLQRQVRSKGRVPAAPQEKTSPMQKGRQRVQEPVQKEPPLFVPKDMTPLHQKLRVVLPEMVLSFSAQNSNLLLQVFLRESIKKYIVAEQAVFPMNFFFRRDAASLMQKMLDQAKKEYKTSSSAKQSVDVVVDEILLQMSLLIEKNLDTSSSTDALQKKLVEIAVDAMAPRVEKVLLKTHLPKAVDQLLVVLKDQLAIHREIQEIVKKEKQSKIQKAKELSARLHKERREPKTPQEKKEILQFLTLDEEKKIIHEAIEERRSRLHPVFHLSKEELTEDPAEVFQRKSLEFFTQKTNEIFDQLLDGEAVDTMMEMLIARKEEVLATCKGQPFPQALFSVVLTKEYSDEIKGVLKGHLLPYIKESAGLGIRDYFMETLTQPKKLKKLIYHSAQKSIVNAVRMSFMKKVLQENKIIKKKEFINLTEKGRETLIFRLVKEYKERTGDQSLEVNKCANELIDLMETFFKENPSLSIDSFFAIPDAPGFYDQNGNFVKDTSLFKEVGELARRLFSVILQADVVPNITGLETFFIHTLLGLLADYRQEGQKANQHVIGQIVGVLNDYEKHPNEIKELFAFDQEAWTLQRQNRDLQSLTGEIDSLIKKLITYSAKKNAEYYSSWAGYLIDAFNVVAKGKGGITREYLDLGFEEFIKDQELMKNLFLHMIDKIDLSQ